MQRRLVIILVLPILVSWKVIDSYASLFKWEQTEIAFRETKGWANGAGMMEMVQYVSQLPKGLVIADTQRGHPATTLHVFNQYYPQLQVIDLQQHILNDIKSIYQSTQKEKRNLYFVFDARRPGERIWADYIASHEQLCAQKKIISKRFQKEILNDSAVIICQAHGFTGDFSTQHFKYMDLVIKQQTEVIERNNNILAYYHRGKSYVTLKQFKKGIDDLTKVIESGVLSEGFQVPVNFDNPAFIDEGNDEVEEIAHGIFQDVYLARGSAYIGFGEYEKGIGDLTKELEFNPNEPVIYYNRGYAYKNLKQYDKALEDFTKAIELKRNFLQSYQQRGMIYLERGNLDLACLDWKYMCQQGICKEYEEAKKSSDCL